MRSLAYFIIPDRKLASAPDGAALVIPTLSAGQEWELAFRFLDRVDGALVEVSPYVRSVRASVGLVDLRPESGEWKLKIAAGAVSASNTTDWLDWNVEQDIFEAALNALAGKPDDLVVVKTSGSWIVRRSDGGQLDLSVVGNTLSPTSFANIEGWEEGGVWFYEIRHKQAPLVFTSLSQRVDPPEPRIEPMADGGNDTVSFWNEIQKLTVPPDFRGGYIIRNPDTLVRTGRLDNDDTSDSLTTALTTLMRDTVTMTDSETPGVGFIEFGGATLTGYDQPLLQVEVIDTPPGDITISLPIKGPSLRAALRQNTTLKDLPFEVEFEFVADEAGETDPDAPANTVKSAGMKATISCEVAWEMLELVAGRDWLLPPRDQTLMHWNADQVAQGVQHYVAVVGDGATLSPIIAHNLDTEEIAEVMIFDQATGAVLNRGADYTLAITSANAITLTFPAAPAAEALRVVITAAIPITAFAGHTHDTAQISRDSVALNTILDDIGERLVVLETILPSTGPAASATQSSGITIRLPQTKEALFFTGSAADIFTDTGDIDPTLLAAQRPPYLLPAVHKASVADTTVVPSPASGSVWVNSGAVPLQLFGGGGIRSAIVQPGEFMASDGRLVFGASHIDTTTSFYPRAFERQLWQLFVNDKMLAAHRTLDVQFGLALQLINATCDGEWVLVIEKGVASSDTTPSTPGPNLQNINWDATPILSQRLILTPLLQTHSFGTRIKRSIVASADTLALDTLLYGIWSGNNAAAPATANFALRSRLINFDIENINSDSARGWVTYQVISPDGFGDGTTGEVSPPKAVIS